MEDALSSLPGSELMDKAGIEAWPRLSKIVDSV
jgi:hypothetical protein